VPLGDRGASHGRAPGIKMLDRREPANSATASVQWGGWVRQPHQALRLTGRPLPRRTGRLRHAARQGCSIKAVAAL
jgi:hypothetical protein